MKTSTWLIIGVLLLVLMNNDAHSSMGDWSPAAGGVAA